MSEGFLTRWSRLKREAEEASPEAPAAAPSGQPDTPTPETQEASSSEAEILAVDLDALPPIESIAADTDIRAFLAPGIPAQLTRAALRRVWSADPAIRDFVGLSENAWDFNDPASVPGFGPALAPEDAKRLLAEMMRDGGPDRPPPAQRDPLQSPDNSVPACEKSAPQGEPVVPPAERPAAVADDGEPRDCAAHDEPAQQPPISAARRHGGALPS
jgi:uncharacterized protein DUF3306